MVVLGALAVTGCGSSSQAIPKPSDVRAALDRHGISLENWTTNLQGCIVLRPRASNSGAVRTFGRFTLVIAKQDSCNKAQMTGAADGDHLYWVRVRSGWMAHEQLVANLWLRMSTPGHKLTDKQHALETAAYHAFTTNT